MKASLPMFNCFDMALYSFNRTYLWVPLPAWISNYTDYKMCDEITYPFPNFNGCTVEVWKWISNFIPHFACDYLSMLGLKLIHVRKGGPWGLLYRQGLAQPTQSVWHGWVIRFIEKWSVITRWILGHESDWIEFVQRRHTSFRTC